MKGETYPGVIGPTQEEITWANSQKGPIKEPKGWLKRAAAVSAVTGLGVAGVAINAPDVSAAINEDVGSLPSSSFTDNQLVFTRPSQNQPNALGEEAQEETPTPPAEPEKTPDQEIPALEGEQEFIPIISSENPASFFGRVSKENSRVFQSITGLEVSEGQQLTLNGSLDATGLPNVVGGIGILDANRGNVQFHLDYGPNGWDAYFRYLDSAGKANIIRKNFSGTNLDPVNDFSITFRPGGNVAVSLGTGEKAVFSSLPDDVLTTGAVRVGTYVAGNESVLNIKSLNYAVGEATVQPAEPTPEPAPTKEPPKEPLETGWETWEVITPENPVSVEDVYPGLPINYNWLQPRVVIVPPNSPLKILTQLSLKPINTTETQYTVGGILIQSGADRSPNNRIVFSRAQGAWEILIAGRGEPLNKIAEVANDSKSITSAIFEITLDANGQTGSIKSLGEQTIKVANFDLGKQFYMPERGLGIAVFSQKNTRATVSRLEISTQTAQSK